MTRAGLIESIFWGHVDKTSDDGCWIWTGSSSKPTPTAAVYGKYGERGVAHRVAYEQIVGPIPAGLELDHLCRRTLCVNPDHLEPVTHVENMRRRTAALTHCKRGHELTDENTIGDSKRCATCERERSLAYYYRVRRPRNDVGRREIECRNGHPRTQENTYVSPKGQRSCRECRTNRDAS